MILMLTLNSFFWAEIIIMVFCAEFENSFGSNLFMRIAWKSNSFVCRWQGAACATDCAHSRSSTRLFSIHCSSTNPMLQLFSDYRLALHSAWCKFVCRCVRPLTGGPCTLRTLTFPRNFIHKKFCPQKLCVHYSQSSLISRFLLLCKHLRNCSELTYQSNSLSWT